MLHAELPGTITLFYDNLLFYDFSGCFLSNNEIIWIFCEWPPSNFAVSQFLGDFLCWKVFWCCLYVSIYTVDAIKKKRYILNILNKSSEFKYYDMSGPDWDIVKDSLIKWRLKVIGRVHQTKKYLKLILELSCFIEFCFLFKNSSIYCSLFW